MPALRGAGRDVVHVRDVNMHQALDPEVLELDRPSQDRVVISADTDSATSLPALAHRVRRSSSCDRVVGRGAAVQAALVIGCIEQVSRDLEAGAVVVIGEDTLRIRRPPIGGQPE